MEWFQSKCLETNQRKAFQLFTLKFSKNLTDTALLITQYAFQDRKLRRINNIKPAFQILLWTFRDKIVVAIFIKHTD